MSQDIDRKGRIGPQGVHEIQSNALNDIKQMNVGELLGEDVEKSRNMMLLATFLAVAFYVFDVSQVQVFGAKISISEGGDVLLALFVFIAISAVSLFHWVNVRSDLVAKDAHQQILFLTLHQNVALLTDIEADLMSDGDQVTSEAAKAAKIRLEQTGHKISSQKTWVLWTSAILSLLCPITVMLAIVLDLFFIT
ncbi:hypothetical protein GCM10007385_02700 [Tateyamaria omphalii]|uniref:hypothetical protein n=1 Tax=Tateyamaria omphalii TaxID=299262 RepID=UPI001675FD88|nr:hypothetical protein [Tateyamaria omphalii]GGX39197.1 hypothetical protein GCM10007385_02700 [Tateyamaria omphalii]